MAEEITKKIVRKRRTITAWDGIKENDVLVISKVGDNKFLVEVKQ